MMKKVLACMAIAVLSVGIGPAFAPHASGQFKTGAGIAAAARPIIRFAAVDGYMYFKDYETG